MQQRTRAWLIDRVCASRAQARWAEPPYRGRGVLGADFAGMGIVYWLVPEAEDAQAAIDERATFAQQVEKMERRRLNIVMHEAAFESAGDSPGVVGRMLIDALQELRRASP
jgi:hypothetical protein